MTTQELAKNTLDLLKKDGWTKDTLGSVDGPKCLLGATLYAAGEFSPVKSGIVYDYVTKRDLCDLMRAEIGDQTLSMWNDDPERTFDEVVALLSKFL